MANKIMRAAVAPMTLATALGTGTVTASANGNTDAVTAALTSNQTEANQFIAKLSRTAELNATLAAEYEAAAKAAIMGNVAAVEKYEADFAEHVRQMSELSETEQVRLQEMFMRNKRRLWTFIEEAEAYMTGVTEVATEYETEVIATVDANAKAIANYVSQATNVAKDNKAAGDAYAEQLTAVAAENRRADEVYAAAIVEYDRQAAAREEILRQNAEIDKRNTDKRSRYEIEKELIGRVNAAVNAKVLTTEAARQEALTHNAGVEARNAEKKSAYERELKAWQDSAGTAAVDVTVEGEKLFVDDKMVVTKVGENYKTYVKDPSLSVPIGASLFQQVTSTTANAFRKDSDTMLALNRVGDAYWELSRVKTSGVIYDTTITTDAVNVFTSLYRPGGEQVVDDTFVTRAVDHEEIGGLSSEASPLKVDFWNDLNEPVKLGFLLSMGLARFNNTPVRITPREGGSIALVHLPPGFTADKQADGSYVVNATIDQNGKLSHEISMVFAVQGSGFDVSSLGEERGVSLRIPGQSHENGGDGRFVHSPSGNYKWLFNNTYVDARPKTTSVTPPPTLPVYESLRSVPAPIETIDLGTAVEPTYEKLVDVPSAPIKPTRAVYRLAPTAPVMKIMPAEPSLTSLPTKPVISATMPNIPVMEGPTAAAIDFSTLRLPTVPTLKKLPNLSLRPIDATLPQFKGVSTVPTVTPVTKTASATSLSVRQTFGTRNAPVNSLIKRLFGKQ